MSDLKEIKIRIYEEDKVWDIYEAMGCQKIKQAGDRVEAQLPARFHSDNPRSTQTKLNESLSSSIRNRADFDGGDIFSLVSYIHHDMRGDDIQKDLFNSKNFICEVLGWREYLDKSYKKKEDPLKAMKSLMRRKRKREIRPNPVLPEEVLNDYIQYPNKKWMEEGISYETQMMYGIGFDLESKRITIPMRNRFGQLVGVKGRIFNDNDDWRKYMYLYKYNNSQELFNFHYAYPYVLSEKKVYVFEAEKSTMKMFQYGIYNTVAIGASDPAQEQINLLKSCGLDVQIILCYDSDKTAEEVQHVADLFTEREVYAIFDRDGLLDDKMSPIDKGIEVFKELEEKHKMRVA